MLAINPQKNEKWKNHQFDWVYANLNCSHCASIGIPQCLPHGDDEYYKKCATTDMWWYSDFVRTFATLIYHGSHNEDTIYIDCMFPTMPESPPSIEIDNSVKFVVASVFHNHHFAVLKIDLEQDCVIIYDGLKRAESSWIPHVSYVYKRIQRKPANFEMVHCTPEHFGSMILSQTDSHNCGPIACVVIWFLFFPTEAPIGIDSNDFRVVVVDKMKSMLYDAMKNGDLTCEIKKDVLDLYDGENIIAKVEDSCEEERLNSFLSGVEEKKQMDKLRVEAQAKQVVKMKKLYNQSVSTKIGDIVLVRVPKIIRVPNKTLNLVGVVLNVNENTKSALVATRHGIIKPGHLKTCLYFFEKLKHHFEKNAIKVFV